MSEADKAKETLQHHARFGVFRKIHNVRDFLLVLRADVWNRVRGYSVRVLEEAVEAEKVKGGFNKKFPEPLVTYSPRRSRTSLDQDFYSAAPRVPFPWPQGLGYHESLYMCY